MIRNLCSEGRPTVGRQSPFRFSFLNVRAVSPTRRSASRASRGLLAAFGLAGAALAQAGPAVHVSTSQDVSLGSQSFEDSDLLYVENAVAGAHFLGGHWKASGGLVPTDVDGFARRPGTAPGRAASMAFSMLSDGGGFLDGDVLGIAAQGGLEVIVAEADILSGLGLASGAIDVDALDFDSQGRLVFSLQSDLSGTALGDLQDGDVLRLESSGAVSLVFSEADVQTLFTLASGSTSAIGDVQAIEVAANDEVWVAIQSPSSYDGAVLSCAAVPSIVLDETAMGLGGAEIDALSIAQPGDQIACFTFDSDSAAPGATLSVSAHGEPNALYLVLMAGNVGAFDFSKHPGFGTWYFDVNDPWLRSVITGAGTPYVRFDSSGAFTTSWTVPSAALYGIGFTGEEGWSFQMMNLSSFELSAPFRVVKI